MAGIVAVALSSSERTYSHHLVAAICLAFVESFGKTRTGCTHLAGSAGLSASQVPSKCGTVAVGGCEWPIVSSTYSFSNYF